jgi:hypothetical protein
LLGGELFGCTAWKFARFVAQGCLGATAAACHIRAEGYPVPVEQPLPWRLWAASAARLALRWPDEGAFAVRLLLQGHVNLVRPELRVDGSTRTLYPARVGGSVGVDMILALE